MPDLILEYKTDPSRDHNTLATILAQTSIGLVFGAVAYLLGGMLAVTTTVLLNWPKLAIPAYLIPSIVMWLIASRIGKSYPRHGIMLLVTGITLVAGFLFYLVSLIFFLGRATE